MKSRKKTKKNTKKTWFIPVRGSYLPNSWQAWVLYIPFVSFLILVLLYAKHTQDTFSGAFFMAFPQWVCAAIVMTWIAKKKS